MLRETKFGYGFLLLGFGVPYLIEKMLGLSWAITCSIACVVIGGSFLWSGHRHKESDNGPKRKLWEIVAFVTALSTLVVLLSLAAIRYVPNSEAGKKSDASNEKARSIGPGSGPLTADDAQIEPVNWVLQEPNESSNKLLNFRVQVKNIGPRPVIETRLAGMTCTADHIMTSTEEEEHMILTREIMYRTSSNKNPLEPGSSKRFFDISNKEMDGEKEMRQMLAGKSYLYYFLVFKARDQNTPEGMYGTTEYCVYFNKTKNSFNNCQVAEISYLGHMVDK